MWNGDQCSTFKAFKEAIRSCINFSISGIPFVAFDFAGYTEEEELTAELYKRSLAMAAFSPVMQFHSAYSGDANLERSPWGVASRLNAPSCVSVYNKYANLRFNIIPYLYTETIYTSDNAIPLMNPLFTKYPSDSICVSNEFDYFLGRNLLVYPITEPNIDSAKIYLPEGSWYDFWDYKLYQGNQYYTIEAPEDHLPVFIKNGSIIPLNLDSNYILAKNMTNDLNSYNNLTFFVSPDGDVTYKYHDYTNDSQKEIRVISKANNISIRVPKFETNISFIIKTPFIELTSITNGKPDLVSTMNDFINNSNSYYYNNEDQLLYMKLNSVEEESEFNIKIN